MPAADYRGLGRGGRARLKEQVPLPTLWCVLGAGRTGSGHPEVSPVLDWACSGPCFPEELAEYARGGGTSCEVRSTSLPCWETGGWGVSIQQLLLSHMLACLSSHPSVMDPIAALVGRWGRCAAKGECCHPGHFLLGTGSAWECRP